MRRLLECLPVLVLFGCWGPHESSLFKPDGTQSSLTGLDTSAGAGGGGSGPSAGSGYGGVAGQETSPPSGGAPGYPSGGSGGAPPGGGAGTGGGGSSAQAGNEGGEGGSGHPPSPASCDAIEGAVTNATNGHCYRVSLDTVDFATAREACRVAGAHLVTITSEAENLFVSALLPQEHWLGTSDGRADTVMGVGEYRWVNDEPWSYSVWRDGQPNALETSCPTEAEGKACYEHCGYQTADVDWVDRPCWHTIASVCEWELDGAAAVK
jgi:hypothetical protein